jgi:hypothetical protein
VSSLFGAVLGVFLKFWLVSGGWQPYFYQGGTYEAGRMQQSPPRPVATTPCPANFAFPATWQIHAADYVDVTGDGVTECVLLVWRPWRDWPVMRWSSGSSPITAHHDAEGYSAHIVLAEPSATSRRGYRELWAGSALAMPVRRTAVGDVDGDGRPELIVLEGDYQRGRIGPARDWAVWRWNGFGFTLDRRSAPGEFSALALADSDGDGRVEVWLYSHEGKFPPVLPE